jgi:hypothetical protein
MNNIQQLQHDLASTLNRTEKIRKILRISQTFCYGGAALYFAGLIAANSMIYTGHGSPFVNDYVANPDPTFWEANKMLVLILPLIALVSIGSAGMGYFYHRFDTAERDTVRRIVREMLPEAKCRIETSLFSETLVQASNFFSSLYRSRVMPAAFSFGSIAFERDGQKLDIRDVAINTGYSTRAGGIARMFKTLFRGIFTARIENAASSFRGMFAHARLPKAIGGSVVILPDHLECHVDYLAKTIQSLRNINGNRLVRLEDVEFERYFAVYSTDETLARYVLTPAMMLRMTGLRKKYDRDIMLSFNRDAFFFAVAMPEGLLTLGRSKVNTGDVVGDLYDNIQTAREILKDLKLDNVPKQEIRL